MSNTSADPRDGAINAKTVGTGTTIGVGLGTVLGVALDDMGTGISLGIGIGLALALAVNLASKGRTDRG